MASDAACSVGTCDLAMFLYSGQVNSVTRGSFLASAHRELSVALVQSQGYVYRSCKLLLAKVSGQPVLPGADTPYLD
jgi:hypothetical protein